MRKLMLCLPAVSAGWLLATTAAMAQEGVGGGVKFFRQTRPGDKIAHQDKQRHDGEFIINGGVKCGLANSGHGTCRPQNPGHAGKTNGRNATQGSSVYSARTGSTW